MLETITTPPTTPIVHCGGDGAGGDGSGGGCTHSTHSVSSDAGSSSRLIHPRSVLEMDRERRARREAFRSRSLVAPDWGALGDADEDDHDEGSAVADDNSVPRHPFSYPMYRSTDLNSPIEMAAPALLCHRGPTSHKRRRLSLSLFRTATCDGPHRHHTQQYPQPVLHMIPASSSSSLYKRTYYAPYEDGYDEEDDDDEILLCNNYAEAGDDESMLMPSLMDDCCGGQ